MPKKKKKSTPEPEGPGPAGMHQFVSCTPTTLSEVLSTYKAAFSSGKPVWTWAYVGRCKGGEPVPQFVARRASMSGKKLVITGTRTQPDGSESPVQLTVGPDFVAWVDDGEPKPNSVPWAAFVACPVKEA